MYQTIKNQVMPDQTEAFTDFTNIKTIRSRLSHKKLISADFIDVVSGWFRAQYITVDQTLDGIPNVVIFTARNVDEEKKREEHLIRISMTDEMTRLFNRRCYDEDLKEFRKGDLAENFVLFSIDVIDLTHPYFTASIIASTAVLISAFALSASSLESCLV